MDATDDTPKIEGYSRPDENIGKFSAKTLKNEKKSFW